MLKVKARSNKTVVVNSGKNLIFKVAEPGSSIGVKYASAFEGMQQVVSGFKVGSVQRLQKSSGLTLSRIKQVARISEASLARRKKTGRLSPDESERILRIGRLFELAMNLHGGDATAAREWLETPIPSLENHRPLEMARTDLGAREVENLIGRIEHGVVS